MDLALVVALAAVAVYYVASPLGKGAVPEATDEATATEEAEARKRTALEAIVDLENERAVGKLDESEFRALRRDYEREAVDALHALDALTAADQDDVEAEIAALRAQLECPYCGAARVPGERCSRCDA